MNNWKLRMASVTLAVCMTAACAAPAFAAQVQTTESAQKSGTVVDSLLDIPFIGDLLRLFIPDNTATPESAATDETTTTPESARMLTAETASAMGAAQTATAESAEAGASNENTMSSPETAAKEAPVVADTVAAVTWPAAWMIGAAQTGKTYPMGSSTAPALAATQTLWGGVELYSGAILRASSREETNLGSLVADALAVAAASDSRYTTDPNLNTLPIVAVLDGARLSSTVEPGTAMDAAELATVLQDDTVSMVTVTPAKLKEIINAALVGMLDATSENFGSFLQVSGLRFTYATTNGEQRIDAAWLADAATAEGKPLDLNDTTSKIALVLPASLRDTYGVNAASSYSDWLNGANITLQGAMMALPANVDADTLTAMLARCGSSGRILPVTAANFDAMLLSAQPNANTRVKGLLDGKEIEFVTNDKGSLIIENLTPGSHTLRMKEGEPAYYISSVTHIGTADGSIVQVASIPEDCVLGPITTPTPAPTPAPTETPQPQNHEESKSDTNEDTGDTAPAATAVPVPVPVLTAKPQSAAGATAAPIKDPTQGTILNTTPAPTLEPTPTPTPSPTPNVTPGPTADPTVIEQIQQAEKKSSQLPLYAGLGLLGVCAVVGGGLYTKRKYDDAKAEKSRAERYRK